MSHDLLETTDQTSSQANPLPSADDIFCAAIEIPAPAERAAYIQSACTGNERLLREVQELVDAYFQAGNFLEAPAGMLTGAVESAIQETPGTTIGPYKLLEQIGEGGFAVVFMAEQLEPVRRRVALKIIKAGMDTKQVVARFEAERQALAMMDHPSIAKVFDAGATQAGRPYFVMELVKGVPITRFCDEHNLNIGQRIDLFMQVCQAVQHAHQKGIIHRDIKPTNVLVGTHDDRPLAKVIDFGIAKATETRLTEKTLFTDFHQLIGTPAYMSPEQADGNLDIDTRSDVYSLGVLLYELLAGSPPFDPKELRSKAFAEMQRIIREVEPPTPSARIVSQPLTTQSAAALHRQSDLNRLPQQLRGELDWIVMRSMEKDRNRRYQTAAALADDLARYRTDQPVEARRPSRRYRLKKFIRRNKLAVSAGVAVFAALALGLGIATWMYFQEREALRRAVAAEQEESRLRHNAEAREKIAEAVGFARQYNFQQAEAIFKQLPPTLAWNAANTELFRALGDWHASGGNWQQAVEYFTALVQLNQSEGWDAISLDYSRYAPTLIELGDAETYSRFRREAVERFSGIRDLRAAERLIKLCVLYEADDQLLNALARIRDEVGEIDPANVEKASWAWLSYALLDYRRGEYASSIQFCREVLNDTPTRGYLARHATAHAILALSLARHHQINEARKELAIAQHDADDYRQKWAAGQAEWMYWFDWTIVRILAREAQTLLEQKPVPASS